MTVKKQSPRPEGVTVSLCMIVKDEEAIIARCLESMLPYIDRYDITDTGSTDDTKKIIKEFFDEHNIPGEIYDSKWNGFGKARTTAFENAGEKSTYTWVIDADDFVEGDFSYPEVMDLDGYALNINRGPYGWVRNQIFKTGIGWSYTGVLHEYALCLPLGDKLRLGKILGPYAIEARTEGARNLNTTPQEKYNGDAETLLDALENKDSEHYDPENLRYLFYLGQSYFDAQNYEKALEAYMQRIPKGGWEEEVYYSLYRIAICKSILQHPNPEVARSFIDCWAYRPSRAEPLVQLARLYRLNGMPRHAFLYAAHAIAIPFPATDILFIEKECYAWTAVDEFAATAFYVNKFTEGLAACESLLNNKKLPITHRERIEKNRDQYITQIRVVQPKVASTTNPKKGSSYKKRKKK